MSRFIPVDPEKWAAMVIAQSDLVRYKEICDELDAECTRLKAEVERLYRHGDLMLKFAAANMTFPAYATMAKDWNAAKEGKQS
jgi:hypothetical protein